MITVQVNVSNHDLGGTKGSTLNPGYEISSRNNEKTKLENDVILLSISKAVKRKSLKTKSENVIKLLRRMIYWPTVTDLDLSSTAITQNLVNQISNFTNFTRSYNIFKTIISLSEMLSLTIYLTLLKQNVESNPGMKNNSQALFKILTYNCNGLGDRKKLKRLILKLTPIVDKGGIVFLQETHLTDTNYLKTIWKNKFETNCIKTNSAGVITLFRNDYEVVETLKDSDGRQLVIAVKNNETELILANSYFPNEHKIGINFAESVYLKILEMQHKFPKYRTIAAGDYNACMNLNDSLNRQRTNVEKLLSETINNNNKITNLVDAYRITNKEGGFTWKRGNCYSRLDYIFISPSLTQQLVSAVQDWTFESSDHAAVILTLRCKETQIKGPGIVKVNTTILNNPEVTRQIEEEIIKMMNQTDDSWNPHLILEFFKVAIRTVFSTKVSELRKSINKDIGELEEESNQLEELKIKILEEFTNHQHLNDKINVVDIAMRTLKTKLMQLRTNLSNKLAFKSKVKWFEYGEKSNKFFLNLLKSRQNQKLISTIRNGERVYRGSEVTEGVREFYKDLYAAKPRQNFENDNYYVNCPKLTKEQANVLDNKLTATELFSALKTCKDSSPGPDGIPYVVYLKLWKIAGPIILNAWNYSIDKQILPTSHYESVITLLPKEGKDSLDIKNWRPITLSNCDAKIITKALANKVSKVLDTIIDPAQTAYIPGRAVSDNLRSNFFLKTHCRQKKLESVLISLDAKKAFDSVDHKYIEETLKAYGFGNGFINIFKLLYRNITARILVNGFLSESLNIERGVKQGDALSCAIFIICIDPLLRNINSSKDVKSIDIKYNKEIINFKGAAFADDVSVICKNDNVSIQGVFNEYEKLTIRSGLELNADKTEILNLKNNNQLNLKFWYNGQQIEVKSIPILKICGVYYSSDIEDEYKLNVLDKITKLSYKIKQWTPRLLTMEGKVLIVKTFGLSQLIYNMQSYGFKDIDLKNAEKLIFKFIWSSKENDNGIDRISRSIMKNNYENGGMKVTDVECLDRSIKLKQFIRAHKSKHIISKFQGMATQNYHISQEYFNITEKEDICRSAQTTLNLITDYNRERYKEISVEERESDKNLIDEVSSINLKTFLSRKGHMFMLCILKQLNKAGITTLADLVQAYEYEKNINLLKSIKLILSSFPKDLVEIAKNFNDSINDDSEILQYILITQSERMSICSVSVKQIQIKLKTVLKRVESTNFERKLGIAEFKQEEIIVFRKQCKNSKLRNIYFRLINRDFFTHLRMKKYNMVNSDSCPRCGLTETINHLLWECTHSKQIWNLYNKLSADQLESHNPVINYEGVYSFELNPAATLLKIKVIQALIQIVRPKNWNENNMKSLLDDLIKTEKYIAFKNFNVKAFLTKWKIPL